MSPPPDKALAAALDYIAKGFRVVPIPHRQKGPVIKEWQSLVIRAEDAPAHFRGTCNIGVILGHGDATDVDLDCAEAIAAAGYLLPRTATFGHASRPFSHFIYVCHGLAASEEHAARKWTSTDGGGLLELRSGGGGAAAQTVFPPSIHPSGEPIAWDDGEDIRQVDPHDLVTACNRLAACALLARLYPKEGARHDAALVLGGFLAGCEIGVPYIKLMLEAIGAASGQPREKIRDMIRSAADGAGLQRPAGLPKMVEAFGKEVTAKCAGWLGYVARGEDKPYKAEAAMPNGEWPGPNGWAMALIRAADVEPKPVSWLWRGWLARGKMHLIAGQPGAGKTTIALKAAATVSSGGQWPDGSLAEQGNVVIWSGEDDLADTLIPRLEASGADLTRVFFAGEMSYGKERRAFDPAKDIPALQAAIDKAGGASLIVVDPIVSATVADSHKNSETRRGLQPLVDMAATINAALIGVTHFTKRSEGIAPIDRVTGSVAFGALARIVLVAAKQQDGTDSKAGPRVLMRAKSNIGPDDGGFNYELQLVPMRSRPDIVASVVNWGGVVYGKARDILAEAEATDDKDEATARHEAEDFLLDFLADGPKPAKECKAAARDTGHSPRTIDRAKSKLRIASVKDGMTGGWVWSLPEGGQHSSKNAKNATNPCQENLASFGNDGDLRGESEAINNGSSSAMRDSWEAEI